MFFLSTRSTSKFARVTTWCSKALVLNNTQEVCQLTLQIIPQGTLNILHLQTTLEDRIKQAQDKDEEIQYFKVQSSKKELPGFRNDEQGKLWYEDRICVPKDEALRRLILDKAHHSA